MAIVLAVFTVLIFYDLQRFIRNKEQARVYAIYIFFMATSLAVSLLLASGRRPSSPSQWIEGALKMIGVLK
mgnify:FL=1